MSTTKTKIELVRMAWLGELRRQGHRQRCGWGGFGSLRVCAMGLLWEVAGKPADAHTYQQIGALAGLGPEWTWRILRMNDGVSRFRKHTFAEIADVVASGQLPSRDLQRRA